MGPIRRGRSVVSSTKLKRRGSRRRTIPLRKRTSMNSKIITNIIKESFRFLLTERGCQLAKEEDTVYGVFLTYTSRKAGIRISYEPREGGVFVMIFPLVTGEIPEYRDWFDFLDFLSAMDKPFKEPIITNLETPKVAELKKTLEVYAYAVRDHFNDYLTGDFTITKKLEDIVNQRKEEFRDNK